LSAPNRNPERQAYGAGKFGSGPAAAEKGGSAAARFSEGLSGGF